MGVNEELAHKREAEMPRELTERQCLPVVHIKQVTFVGRTNSI